MGMTNTHPDPYDEPFEPADLEALDNENHARDAREEHFDGSWRDR